MLIIVPASKDEAHKHFKKTVREPWNVDKIKDLGILLPADVESKLRAVGDFRIWGAVHSIVKNNRIPWDRLEGCVTAFYQEGKIVCWGKVIAKLHSSNLAEKLWGRDKEGRTWEYVYFIGDLTWAEIPWEKLRDALGYSKNYTPRGHRYAGDRVAKVLEEKGYGSVEEFLRDLAGIGNHNDTASPRGFNANELQLHKVGDKLVEIARDKTGIGEGGYSDRFSASIALYGWAIVSLSEDLTSEKVSKERVESLEKKLSKNIKGRLYNDLRRLGLISLGKSGNWGRGAEARFASLFKRVSSCLRLLGDIGIRGSDAYIIAGVLPFIYCISGLGEYSDESGVCSRLRELKDLSGLDEGTRRVVEAAIRLVAPNVNNEVKPKDFKIKRFVSLCIDYGADLWRVRELSSKLR